MKMEIIYKQTSELIPYINNPRKNDKAVDAVASSIKNFGFKVPIIIDSQGEIIAGHTRLKAAKKLDIKEVPCLIADDLTPAQIKAFRIADNKVSESAEWDIDLLKIEIQDLDEFTGFELEELNIMFEEEKEIIEDEVPEVQEEVITKLGDLYEIGEHRLLCGDSTDGEQVAKLMNGKKAELLFTSPPYSDMREYNGKKDLSVDNIAKFIPTWMPFVEYQVVNLGIQRKDNDIVQYWNNYIDKARSCGYKLMAWNVWKKSSVSVGQQSAFIPIYHEWIFVFGTKFKHINRTWERKQKATLKNKRKVRQADGSLKESTIGKQEIMKEMESVFISNVELGEIRKQHPGTFPIDLPTEYIKAITNKNEIISESFLGSGTTMIASHQLNRKCYGMELDPKYCDVIIRRMINLDPQITIKRNGIDCKQEFTK
jgi:site-specific DNA-methyltransferase (adenine-specific)